MCAKFLVSGLIFILISCQQLLTAVTVFFIGIFIYPLNVIFLPKLISLGWFLFSLTFISCHQLLTAVDSWWQLIWIKFDWNFHTHTIGDISAQFQLSRLIFILISFWQLLTADDSSHEFFLMGSSSTPQSWYLCKISCL